MNCNGCGNDAAYAVRTVYDDGRLQDSCDRCGGGRSIANVPDVFFKEPYFDENLGSQDDPGPKFIGSKSEKAYWLKKRNLREAGDRVHGATSFDPKYSRIAHDNYRRSLNHG
jgi:hypothetical protein